MIHHSDSYAANLVPSMIEMGIDIWQGVMSTNNIPELIEKYGGQITFMGGIDSGEVDREDWSREHIAQEVERVCRENGTKFFIPCNTMGARNLSSRAYMTRSRKRSPKSALNSSDINTPPKRRQIYAG